MRNLERRTETRQDGWLNGLDGCPRCSSDGWGPLKFEEGSWVGKEDGGSSKMDICEQGAKESRAPLPLLEPTVFVAANLVMMQVLLNSNQTADGLGNISSSKLHNTFDGRMQSATYFHDGKADK